MRFTLFSRLFLVALYAASATAAIAFTQVPALMYTGKTYTIAWGGGDGTTVTVALVLGSSGSSTVSTVGTVWTGSGVSIYWTVGTALKASNYYALKISQSGVVNYSGYFSLVNGSSSSNTIASSTSRSSTATTLSSATSIQSTSQTVVITSVSTEVSSVATTVTSVSTYIPSSISTTAQLTSSSALSLSDYTPGIATKSATSTLMTSPYASSTVLSANANTNNNNNEKSSGLSPGALAGIVVGAIAGVALILIAVIFVLRRPFQQDEPNENAEMTQPSPPAPTQNHQQNWSAGGDEAQQQHPYPQQYQQPYPQEQPPYQQPYQPYQPPQYQQQQYQQPYQQQQYAPLLGHELGSPQDMKVSPVSPSNSYAVMQNNHHQQQGTNSDGGSEVDRNALPTYEKDVAVSVQPVQVVQQAQPPHGHGPAYELAGNQGWR